MSTIRTISQGFLKLLLDGFEPYLIRHGLVILALLLLLRHQIPARFCRNRVGTYIQIVHTKKKRSIFFPGFVNKHSETMIEAEI